MVHFSEILVILVVVLLLFGTGKFPKIMENFAEGIKAFKNSMKENKKPTKKTQKKKTPSNKKK